jgi:sugar fermentation stimulation protein A
MQFTTPLIKGTLLKRYKRFLADVQLTDGTLVTAHCPNTGAMTGCAEAGFPVWLSPANNPKRKLGYTWELVQNTQEHWICVNTQRANQIVSDAILAKQVPELIGYGELRNEVKYGAENSRIDIFLRDPNLPDCYVEVKSVTLLENEKGLFPDAKTTRGSKHLRELTQIVQDGQRAVLFYCVQHTGIQSVSAAVEIDSVYTDTLRYAIEQGVEVLVYSTHINQQKITLNQRLNFI